MSLSILLLTLLTIVFCSGSVLALSITSPGTYTLTQDEDTLSISGVTGTYTIEGGGYSILGETTITSPGGNNLTVNITDLNMNSLNGIGNLGIIGSHAVGDGGNGGSGGMGGSISLSIMNGEINGSVNVIGGNGG